MRRPLVLAISLLALLSVATTAHEIPSEVTIQTFLKPEGQRLIFLVRAPMRALREMDVPRRGPFVELATIQPVLRDAATQWIADFVKLYEEESQLPYPEVMATRIALPGDRAFDSYDQALAAVTGAPLPLDTNLVWEEGLLDVAFAFPIRSETSKFSISPGLTRLGVRVNVVMRFLPPGGAERVFDVHGDPGIVQLDPRWHQAAFRFVRDGFFHILDGVDHLLFLLCLVVPFRRLRSLTVVVTSFTIAHSVTLIASAYNLAPTSLWFPPLVETLIAASIVYMAFENIVAAARSGGAESASSADVSDRALQRRWAVAFAFGLIHGFGFSFALRESLQFAGSHLLTSLLSFNIGVELGQLLVLVLLIPVLNVLFRFVVAEKIGTILLSALIAHTGWHWATERGGQLLAFDVPALDIGGLATAMRLLMLVVVAAAIVWVLFGVLFRDRTRFLR
ncbi:MAG TPA: HupE/UreJ family protein [Vicinamibacterales bacterium]|nr:HupE/UreJ family protein [Vicinamibacterales bacterium]